MTVLFLFRQCGTMICFLCCFGIHVGSCISFNIPQFIIIFVIFCLCNLNKCFFADLVILALLKSLFHVLSPPVPAAELSKY